jgi:hypothetical protein
MENLSGLIPARAFSRSRELKTFVFFVDTVTVGLTDFTF